MTRDWILNSHNFTFCDTIWEKQVLEQICTGVQLFEHPYLAVWNSCNKHPWLVMLRRRGKLGDSLVSALEHFIDNERISPELALKVLAEVRSHLRLDTVCHWCPTAPAVC